MNLIVRARKADTPLIAPDHLTVDQPVASLKELEFEDLRLRARHVDAWWRLDESALVRALTRSSSRATKSPQYQALCETIRRLKWDGGCAKYDTWPSDPAVRDTRLRLGAIDTLFLICAIDPVEQRSRTDLDADLEFLAERPLPLIEEAAVAGWDDEERRWSVRHHLGVLAVFEEVIRRGLAPALVQTSPRTRRWEHEVRERRRECVDCLLDLRARGRVTWSGVRNVRWDGAHHEFREFLYHGTNQWSPAPPDWVQLAVTGARSDLSAVFADVTWRTSRTGAPAARVFDAPTFDGHVRFHVASRRGETVAQHSSDESRYTIGLDVTLTEVGAGVALEWSRGGVREGTTRATRLLRV